MPLLFEMFPSRFIKQVDLEEGPIVVTIDTVTQEELQQDDKREKKWL
jgi:hypothetical protein